MRRWPFHLDKAIGDLPSKLRSTKAEGLQHTASLHRDLQAMQNLVADHNAYHLGQIVSVRQALGAWK